MVVIGMIGEAAIQNRFAVAPFQGISSEGSAEPSLITFL